MARAKDLTGQRFGRLTVLYQVRKSRNRHTIWRCRCDDENEVEVQAGNLGTHTNSCGCLRREQAAQQAADRNYRHGGAIRNNRSRLYESWTDIKQRCLNPRDKDFEDYGGRGITMAPEWIEDYTVFRDHVNQNLGPRPSAKNTIDRIENDEGYFPGNIKWSTKSQQGHNSRRSVVNKVVDAAVREYVKPSKQRPFRRVY